MKGQIKDQTRNKQEWNYLNKGATNTDSPAKESQIEVMIDCCETHDCSIIKVGILQKVIVLW